jgi:hypothetical protein
MAIGKALAVAGKWDAHITALVDGGHIKFFSIRTLKSYMTDGRVDVITSVERRRRWSVTEKERLVVAAQEPGAGLSAIHHLGRRCYQYSAVNIRMGKCGFDPKRVQ